MHQNSGLNQNPGLESKVWFRAEFWCKALQQHNLDVPPKSACVFCPYHNKAEWRLLKQQGGPDWDHAVAVDREIRKKRDTTDVFIHPSRLPLEEAVRIPEDVGAQQLELDIPCDGGACFI